MRVLGKFIWNAFLIDPSNVRACGYVKVILGYKWRLVGWPGFMGKASGSPVVVVRIMGHDVDLWVELGLGGVRYVDLWEDFSAEQAREIFDAALAKSSELRGIVDSVVELLKVEEPVVPVGKLSDVDEWEEDDIKSREVGSGTVEFEVEITESFDGRLGLALEGVDPFLDRWDSWFVYFINPNDEGACEGALVDFNHKWNSGDEPQVILYLLGDDMQLVYKLGPDGHVIRGVYDALGRYDHLDVGDYNDFVQRLEDRVLAAAPGARKAVKDGLVLLRQVPISRYELPDEDAWGDSGVGVRYAVNYRVLGLGDL